MAFYSSALVCAALSIYFSSFLTFYIRLSVHALPIRTYTSHFTFPFGLYGCGTVPACKRYTHDGGGGKRSRNGGNILNSIEIVRQLSILKYNNEDERKKDAACVFDNLPARAREQHKTKTFLILITH